MKSKALFVIGLILLIAGAIFFEMGFLFKFIGVLMIAAGIVFICLGFSGKEKE